MSAVDRRDRAHFLNLYAFRDFYELTSSSGDTHISGSRVGGGRKMSSGSARGKARVGGSRKIIA